jgi:predicted nucleic acid-binding protein
LESIAGREVGRASSYDSRTLILLDTNVVIDAQNERSRFYTWSNQVIAEGIATNGVGINAITLAELCSAAGVNAEKVQSELHSADIRIIDLPARAAAICGQAYRRYRLARTRSGGGKVSSVPLPDFFIGAHAELMGWKLATRDVERYRIYFPAVELIEPAAVS